MRHRQASPLLSITKLMPYVRPQLVVPTACPAGLNAQHPLTATLDGTSFSGENINLVMQQDSAAIDSTQLNHCSHDHLAMPLCAITSKSGSWAGGRRMTLNADQGQLGGLDMTGVLTVPRIQDLESMSDSQLQAVPGFKVHLESGLAILEWEKPVDLRGTKFAALIANVKIDADGEFSVQSRQLLQCRCKVTLNKIWPESSGRRTTTYGSMPRHTQQGVGRQTEQEFSQVVRASVEGQGDTFLAYDGKLGQLKMVLECASRNNAKPVSRSTNSGATVNAGMSTNNSAGSSKSNTNSQVDSNSAAP